MNFFQSAFYCLAAAILVLAACQQPQPGYKTAVQWYYWKTVFKLSAPERAYLRQCHTQQLYIRLFDVDTVHRGAEVELKPVSILNWADSLPQKTELIPVIYFTRQAILHQQDEDSLAQKIHRLCCSLLGTRMQEVRQIQWDHDWTPRTKNNWFALLNALKQQPAFQSKVFSATLRLHQLKHRQSAGIPPVDRVMLMCYNMGNLNAYETQNSILDLGILQDYISFLSTYPLTTDIGLPVFRWGLLFRDRQFMGILRETNTDTLALRSEFKRISPNWFTVQSATQLHGITLQPGDEIRIEDIPLPVLKQAITTIKKYLPHKNCQWIFFDLQPHIPTQFPAHELQNLVFTP